MFRFIPATRVLSTTKDI